MIGDLQCLLNLIQIGLMQELSKIGKSVIEVLKKISEVRESEKIIYPIRLVAVSKTKPIEDIMQAYKMQIRHFGENYAQQIEQKQPKLPQDIKWHFIGHLQSNKIKKIMVPNLECVETVDRQKIAYKLNDYCLKENRKLNIFIQVNTSQEETKSGVQEKDVFPLYQFIRDKCQQLNFRGLMTIGKEGDEQAFIKLANLKKIMAEKYSIKIEQIELSMGMSADFQTAIKYGSTSVRVGSTIFGARKQVVKQL